MIAEHEWAGDEGILAKHGLLLGDGDALFKALRVEGRAVAMIPQQVHNNPWPILFTAPPLPEGKTPKEGHIYTIGQRQSDYLFDPSTTPPLLMSLPCVQAWPNKIAEKLEEPQWRPSHFTYAHALQTAVATPDVEALSLPLHLPTEQLSEEVRRVMNEGMGKAVLDVQAKAICEEIQIPGGTVRYTFDIQALALIAWNPEPM
eukprot:1857323-Pleurochrysis_carterae.AAC.1